MTGASVIAAVKGMMFISLLCPPSFETVTCAFHSEFDSVSDLGGVTQVLFRFSTCSSNLLGMMMMSLAFSPTDLAVL